MTKKIKNQTFGELEADIMEIIWELDQVTVRQVLNRLRKKRDIAYTTVMTVMSRLADKGVLKRQLDENSAYIYQPSQDKKTFLAASSKKAINNLLNDFGEIAVAQFIDIIETNDWKNTDEWRKKLKKIK